MRSHANGLKVEVDCPSFGSSECPSMSSSFSPMDPPTPKTASVYGQGSLTSPGWPEGGSFSAQAYERQTGSSPLRSSIRLAEITSQNGMPFMDTQEQKLPLPDYLPGYDENSEQFWMSSDMPKTYDNPGAFSCPPTMNQYPSMGRRPSRPYQGPCLPESATNPCLSRPMFNQPERMPNSVSMDNILPWLPPANSMGPQTIAPSQAFPTAPMTPPPSYSDFSAPLGNLDAQTPVTPVRSCSFSTPSGPNTPMSRVSGTTADYTEEFPISPAYRTGFPRHLQCQSSRRATRRSSSKQNLTLDTLPSIIKQVQFKCKVPGCRGRFKRQEHLKRHMKSHSKEKPHVCWVPGCQRAFSRSDNLNAHYTKTHSKRGGRNRYVATLDVNSPDYDPEFRGQLTADGRPIYGTQLEETMDTREFSVDIWDD